jgi:hypothetical protein
MIKLTEDQRHELSSPEPVAMDPQTRQVYVLVRKEVYDKLRSILEDLPETGALMNEVMAADDANDPYLASYQRYRKEPR